MTSPFKSPLVVSTLSLIVLALACSSETTASEQKVGGSCTPPAALCDTDKLLLRCQDGKYAAFPCNGPRGCKQESDVALCDDSTTQLGEACFGEGSKACAPDGTRFLVCRNGKREESSECLGPDKCRLDGDKSRCDQTIGREGGDCDTIGTYACSVDETKILECKDGKFVVNDDCAAVERKCTRTAEALTCG